MRNPNTADGHSIKTTAEIGSCPHCGHFPTQVVVGLDDQPETWHMRIGLEPHDNSLWVRDLAVQAACPAWPETTRMVPFNQHLGFWQLILSLAYRYGLPEGYRLRIVQTPDLRGEATVEQLRCEFLLLDADVIVSASSYVERVMPVIEREVPEFLRPFQPFRGLLLRIVHEPEGIRWIRSEGLITVPEVTHEPLG